ncbi:hypothetical protein ACGFNX_04245 [Streptomyces sp. NPDC048723]|uniref:hypothetical protein n=1 Tax=Streptomyces sp. NPDC048723 TaxID=3365589 RepID=UPI0037149AF2
MGHTAQANAVALSPDGTVLATASDDRTARLWTHHLWAWQNTAVPKGHPDWVNTVAFSPDRRLRGAHRGRARLREPTGPLPSLLTARRALSPRAWLAADADAAP